MRKPSTRASLLARLERLEECRQQLVPRIFRYGWVRALPQEFIGERHLVIVKQRATANLNVEWCQFEPPKRSLARLSPRRATLRRQQASPPAHVAPLLRHA